MTGKINPSYDTQRSLLGKVLPLDTPFRVTLDSSEVCNFKCNYCFRSGKPEKSWGYALKNQLMSFDIFRTAVNQLKEFPSMPRVIALSGSGEPLCNPNIPQMVRYIKEQGFLSKIEIHTNASLLTEKNVKEIAECGINKMVISLQGLDSESYFKTCGAKLDFEYFYRQLSALYQYKGKDTKINIKIVDAAFKNPDEEKKFYQLFMPIADSVFVEKVIALWQEQLTYDEKSNTVSNKFGLDLGEVNRCPIVFTNITISPEGDIWPCCVIHPPFSLGNVKNTRLVDAWCSSERKELLRNNLLRGHLCHARCENCYFPKGYVKTKEDIIDPYYQEILSRLDK